MTKEKMKDIRIKNICELYFCQVLEGFIFEEF